MTVKGTLRTAEEMIANGKVYYDEFERTGIKRALIDFRETRFS